MRTLVRAFAAVAQAVVVALALVGGIEPSAAQPVADLFKGGKPLRIVLGAAPGQDYDLWAGFLARHLGRHVPGAPPVVVQNMPGAGDMLATNWLYNVAPRDGTVWGSVSRNIPNAGFQGFAGVRYDATKFGWIGSPEMTNRGCFAMSWAKVKRAADLFEHELIVGGIGAGATVTETPNLLRGLLGRMILAFLAATLELGRPLMLPPGVPPETIQVMRRAFDATIDDPFFRDEAKKIGLEITHKTGEQIEALIGQAAATPPDIIAKASQMGSGK